MCERITEDSRFDGECRETHEYRYQLAGRFIKPSDVVLDAACGIGYGKKFLGGARYVGIDRELVRDNRVADLNVWQPDFSFDVGVSFETLEHLHSYQNLVDALQKAKRLVIVSTPIIPTKHINPWHVQDFSYDELKGLFSGYGKCIYEEVQGDTYGIFVFKKGVT